VLQFAHYTIVNVTVVIIMISTSVYSITKLAITFILLFACIKFYSVHNILTVKFINYNLLLQYCSGISQLYYLKSKKTTF